jgi:hypothetical protein
VSIFTTVLEFLGAALVVFGLGQVAPWAGFVVAGVFLLVFAVLLDPAVRPAAAEGDEL